MHPPDPSPSVVARYRGWDLHGFSEWRYVICHDREVYRSFLKVWAADLHIEEVGMPSDPTIEFTYWDTVHG